MCGRDHRQAAPACEEAMPIGRPASHAGRAAPPDAGTGAQDLIARASPLAVLEAAASLPGVDWSAVLPNL